MSTPTLIHDSTSEALELGWGETSTYQVAIDPPEQDVDVQHFPNTPGSMAADYGTKGRPITIDGDLRLSEENWAIVIASRDLLIAQGGTWTFTDDDGAEYASCRLTMTVGARQRMMASDDGVVWRAKYRIELYQLEV
jgi:hypothetical protein